MKCYNEEQIQQYLDHECSQVEREEIEQHTKQCRACAASLTLQRKRLAIIKHSIDLMAIHTPGIPEFKTPLRTTRGRKISRKYLWPLIAAASLLLLVLMRPFIKIGDTPSNNFDLQHLTTAEFDSNKPVTDYPIIITLIAPDGSISETIIN